MTGNAENAPGRLLPGFMMCSGISNQRRKSHGWHGNTTDDKAGFRMPRTHGSFFIRGIATPSVGIILIWLRPKTALVNRDSLEEAACRRPVAAAPSVLTPPSEYENAIIFIVTQPSPRPEQSSFFFVCFVSLLQRTLDTDSQRQSFLPERNPAPRSAAADNLLAGD